MPQADLYAELHKRIPKDATRVNLMSTFKEPELRFLMRGNKLPLAIDGKNLKKAQMAAELSKLGPSTPRVAT